MWITRTAEEKEKWMVRTRSQVNTFALQIGVLVLIGMTAGLYFGITLRPSYQMFMGGSARRFGLTGSFLIGLLMALLMANDVRRKKLKEELSQTVCPKCGILGQLNEGGACGCGGAFVKASEVRWVDDPVEGTNSEQSSSDPA